MSGKLPPVIRPICGEYRGWLRHQYLGEETCLDCATARNAYMRGYRRRKGLTKATLYTPEEIEHLTARAVDRALRTFHRNALTSRASRPRARVRA